MCAFPKFKNTEKESHLKGRLKEQDEEKPNSKVNRKIEIRHVIIKIKEIQTNQ